MLNRDRSLKIARLAMKAVQNITICIVIRDFKKIQIRSKLFCNYSQHCLFTFYFEVHFNTRDFLSYLLIQGHLSNLNCLPPCYLGFLKFIC